MVIAFLLRLAAAKTCLAVCLSACISLSFSWPLFTSPSSCLSRFVYFSRAIRHHMVKWLLPLFFLLQHGVFRSPFLLVLSPLLSVSDALSLLGSVSISLFLTISDSICLSWALMLPTAVTLLN